MIYTPAHFKVENKDKLRKFIERNSFATLISSEEVLKLSRVKLDQINVVRVYFEYLTHDPSGCLQRTSVVTLHSIVNCPSAFLNSPRTDYTFLAVRVLPNQASHIDFA